MLSFTDDIENAEYPPVTIEIENASRAFVLAFLVPIFDNPEIYFSDYADRSDDIDAFLAEIQSIL